MGAVRLLPVMVVAAVVCLPPALGKGAGAALTAQSSGVGARPARADPSGRPQPAVGVPSAPVVPAGAPDAATGWLGTTNPHLSVLFSYHREEVACAGRCEQYGFWLRYQAPSGGAAESSPEWRQISHAECADFWTDGAQDIACVSTEGMAGRDRRGNDYVLLQMYATRAQLERMLTARTLVFQIGRFGFHLQPAARDSLRGLLMSAGRATPRR